MSKLPWWNIVRSTKSEIVAVVRKNPELYYEFVKTEYRRMLFVTEWNESPKDKPEEIHKRVDKRAEEVREACRVVVEEELLDTLPEEDERVTYILSHSDDIDLLLRKLPRDNRAINIIKRLKNSTAEGLLRREKHFAEMVCACPTPLLEWVGDRSHLIIFALFDTPWMLCRHGSRRTAKSAIGHNCPSMADIES